MTPSIKQTVLTDPLYAAMRLLSEEADSLRDCHTRTPDDWTGEPEAKAQYDHILEVVALLSKLRAPVADERAARYVPFHDQPQKTGVGEWCAPGPAAEQRQAWWLRFADTDRGDCVYYDEQEARRAFAQTEGRGWNCYLFEYARRAALESAPVAGEVQKPLGYVAVLNAPCSARYFSRITDQQQARICAEQWAKQYADVKPGPWPTEAVAVYAAPQASEAARVQQLEAARIAYAREFPPDENGDPDVGSIHANIRKLKSRVAALSAQPVAQKESRDAE